MSTDGRSPCRSVYVWAEIQVVIELQKFAVLNGIFEGVSNIVSQKYMYQSFFRSRSDYVSLARLLWSLRIKCNKRCARVLAGKRAAMSLPARTRAHRPCAAGCN
jgi:hypothetical protein